MLGVGEREGEIEVLDIDEKGGIVKVNDYGVVTNVPFAKMPNTPSAPVNTAGIPSPNVANPGGIPGVGVAQRSIPGLPARSLRVGNNNQGTGNNQNGLPNTSGYQSQGLSAGLSTAMQAHNPSVPFSETHLTAEEDAILTETDRELHRNNPNYPPLPPTPLTSPEDLKAIMAPTSPPATTKGSRQMPQ